MGTVFEAADFDRALGLNAASGSGEAKPVHESAQVPFVSGHDFQACRNRVVVKLGSTVR